MKIGVKVITYEGAVGKVKRFVGDIRNSKTIKGLEKNIRSLANYMLYLQSISPIEGTFLSYDDIKSMNLDKTPKLKAALFNAVEESLIRADQAYKSYYTAPPEGRPFKVRTIAGIEPIETLVRIAMATSRENYIKGTKARRTRR